VIQAVENLALQQGVTTLKFSHDIRQHIYPADWIAGVDYDDTEYNDEDYNQPDLEEPDDDLNDQVEIEDLIRDAEEQGENEIENASNVEKNETDKENEFKENDIANEIDIKQNDTDDENEFDDNDIDYQDTKKDDYKPDPAAEQEEKNGNDANERDDDSEVETTEDVLPTVTDDEEQSVQETSIRRSTRTITRPSRYNATQSSKKIERKHIILHQTKKDHEQHIEYNTNTAVFAANNRRHYPCGIWERHWVCTAVYLPKRHPEVW
jgi:hypothetical protein